MEKSVTAGDPEQLAHAAPHAQSSSVNFGRLNQRISYLDIT
jgi:hypothetical protein